MSCGAMYAPFVLAHFSDWRMVYVFTRNLMIGFLFSCVLPEGPFFGFTAICSFLLSVVKTKITFWLSGGICSGTKGLMYFACGDQMPSFGETAVSDVLHL
jgi:hypothetical protein